MHPKTIANFITRFPSQMCFQMGIANFFELLLGMGLAGWAVNETSEAKA